MSADRGFHQHRLEFTDDVGRLETELALLWEKENAAVHGTDHGLGLLQNLCVSRGNHPFQLFSGAKIIHKVTDDERRVVATVVQWLGTNIGRAFLETAFRNAGWEITMRPAATPTPQRCPDCGKTEHISGECPARTDSGYY